MGIGGLRLEVLGRAAVCVCVNVRRQVLQQTRHRSTPPIHFPHQPPQCHSDACSSARSISEEKRSSSFPSGGNSTALATSGCSDADQLPLVTVRSGFVRQGSGRVVWYPYTLLAST